MRQQRSLRLDSARVLATFTIAAISQRLARHLSVWISNWAGDTTSAGAVLCGLVSKTGANVSCGGATGEHYKWVTISRQCILALSEIEVYEGVAATDGEEEGPRLSPTSVVVEPISMSCRIRIDGRRHEMSGDTRRISLRPTG